MTIQEKYEVYRPLIKNGDIILFRGNTIISKAIRYCDSCYYTHIGVVFEKNGRLFIVDSNAPGVHADFLSLRIHNYVDFFIMSPRFTEQHINEALTKLFSKAETKIEYDFHLLLRIAIYRKLKKVSKLQKDVNENRDICSEFVRRYTDFLGVTCYDRMKTEWMTPQDFLRYYDKDFLEPKFNDSLA